jgi:hypothetical protein
VTAVVERERSGEQTLAVLPRSYETRNEESKMSNSKKLIDRRIENAFRASCSGVPINIMDISKVFNFGRIKISEGVDDASLAASIRAYVDRFLVYDHDPV